MRLEFGYPNAKWQKFCYGPKHDGKQKAERANRFQNPVDGTEAPTRQVRYTEQSARFSAAPRALWGGKG